jgi:hypothetical protein
MGAHLLIAITTASMTAVIFVLAGAPASAGSAGAVIGICTLYLLHKA